LEKRSETRLYRSRNKKKGPRDSKMKPWGSQARVRYIAGLEQQLDGSCIDIGLQKKSRGAKATKRRSLGIAEEGGSTKVQGQQKKAKING